MKKEIAEKFGRSLDQDDFASAQILLSADCRYDIGDEMLIGPEAICGSYKQNMIAGRKKFDELEWGTARIEPIDDDHFYVHFTDYLTHKKKKYTHRCMQMLTINNEHKIIAIKHIQNKEEQIRLKAYYESVGLG